MLVRSGDGVKVDVVVAAKAIAVAALVCAREGIRVGLFVGTAVFDGRTVLVRVAVSDSVVVSDCAANAVAEARNDSNVSETFGVGGTVSVGSAVRVGRADGVSVSVGSSVSCTVALGEGVSVSVGDSVATTSEVSGTRVEIVRGCPSVCVAVAVRVGRSVAGRSAVPCGCELAVNNATTWVPSCSISLISVALSVGMVVPSDPGVPTIAVDRVAVAVPAGVVPESERMTPKMSANASMPTAAMATTSSLPMSRRILQNPHKSARTVPVRTDLRRQVNCACVVLPHQVNFLSVEVMSLRVVRAFGSCPQGFAAYQNVWRWAEKAFSL